jgi:hypothetical protein
MDAIYRNSTGTRELDSRTSDGIRVRLLWHEPDGRVFVTVADARTGDAFSLVVRDHARALEVFHHPYAHAAWRGLNTRVNSIPPLVSLAA